MSRSFDVIVYGATGYTAGLAIDYLLTGKTGKSLKWAIAGRSKEKLEAVLDDKKKKLRNSSIDPTTVPIIIASVDDDAAMDSLCKQTSVLIAMAGPYMKCGLQTIAACVRNRTHYVDITGEFPFIRQAIEQYHEQAVANKVAIVNTCGFDCVPSDMGSLMMHDFVSKTSGAPAITEMVGYFALRGSTLPSGGTAHSIAGLFDEITSADLSPVSLNPKEAKKGIRSPSQKFIGRSTVSNELSFHTAPFLMAGGNERIVRRSNALLGRATSVYYEASASKSFASAVSTLLSFYILGAVMMIKPFRWLAKKYILPSQGNGPTAEEKKGGGFTITFVASANDGTRYKGVWEDGRNPYDSTAVFVVEAAATIIDFINNKNDYLPGGILTPASAFQMKYLNRLLQRDPGTSIQIEEISKSK